MKSKYLEAMEVQVEMFNALLRDPIRLKSKELNESKFTLVSDHISISGQERMFVKLCFQAPGSPKIFIYNSMYTFGDATSLENCYKYAYMGLQKFILLSKSFKMNDTYMPNVRDLVTKPWSQLKKELDEKQN